HCVMSATLLPRTPRSSLFPYTTLFRSRMVFKEVEKHDLPDIQSTGILYEHEETGAQVLYLKNDDSNKAFTIGFKTPPYNDNGIRSEEHTSELQSRFDLVCRLLLEKKKP